MSAVWHSIVDGQVSTGANEQRGQNEMSDSISSGLRELHKEFAKSAFNHTWDLLDKEDRTEEDNARMVHAAHASRFHRGEVGTPLHWLRGEW